MKKKSSRVDSNLGKNRILPTLQKFCQVKKSVISDRLEKFTWQTKENLHQEPGTETKLFFHPFCLRALVDARFGGERIYARFGPSNAKSHQFAKPNAKWLERAIHRFWQKKWNAKSKCQTVGVALYWGTTLNHYNTNLIRRFSDIPRWHFLWYWVTNV